MSWNSFAKWTQSSKATLLFKKKNHLKCLKQLAKMSKTNVYCWFFFLFGLFAVGHNTIFMWKTIMVMVMQRKCTITVQPHRRRIWYAKDSLKLHSQMIYYFRQKKFVLLFGLFVLWISNGLTQFHSVPCLVCYITKYIYSK